MKRFNNISVLIFAFFLSALSGCKNFLDVNVDPTLKGDATIQELLPTAQLYTSEVSYQQAYVACQYAQQIGSNLGTNGVDSYAEAENALGWSNLYLYVIPQLNIIIQKGQAESAPAYVGIAKTMMAYNLGVAAVNWENIPYSQADKSNFTPGYDTQQSVYTTVQKLLDEGISELAKNSGAKPGSDDMIYGGDLGKWTRLAYALKAKFAMHLSAQNPQSAAQTALAALPNAMKDNGDDFQLMYNSKNLSPWYSRVALANSTSNLSVTYASTYVDLLNGKTQGVTDPRLPVVVTLKNNQTVYQGVVPGSGAGSTVDFNTRAWHSSINSPIVMVTFAEVKAIEAEARFIMNNGTIATKGSTQDAYNAYLDIARANMQKLGISIESINSYLAHPSINIGAAELTLSRIILEKYKAMFLMGDIWTDVRKYNYLDFPMPNNVNPELEGKRMQRMKYPSSELTRNSKNAEANFKEPGTSMWIFTK